MKSIEIIFSTGRKAYGNVFLNRKNCEKLFKTWGLYQGHVMGGITVCVGGGRIPRTSLYDISRRNLKQRWESAVNKSGAYT